VSGSNDELLVLQREQREEFIDPLRKLSAVWQVKARVAAPYSQERNVIAPTNAELAAQFVFDCGDYKAALTKLNIYAAGS
jgi:hypothetical protein